MSDEHGKQNSRGTKLREAHIGADGGMRWNCDSEAKAKRSKAAVGEVRHESNSVAMRVRNGRVDQTAGGRPQKLSLVAADSGGIAENRSR